jgi:hypothetical protein
MRLFAECRRVVAAGFEFALRGLRSLRDLCTGFAWASRWSAEEDDSDQREDHAKL